MDFDICISIATLLHLLLVLTVSDKDGVHGWLEHRWKVEGWNVTLSVLALLCLMVLFQLWSLILCVVIFASSVNYIVSGMELCNIS